MRADVVVVGAGPAGCVLARRLAEAGADVVLLEAGDHVASPRAGLLDVGPGSHVVTRHQARLGGTVLELPRGRTLGGSGAVNGGYCVAARPSDLVSWGPDWPRRHAVGLARAAERLRPTLAPMDPVAARVAAAFPGRVSAVAQARRGARRVTAFDAWDPPGAGVRVRTGARVARLSWADGAAGGRCDGVVLAAARGNAGGGDDDNADGEVVATDLVVLCAGTIGSAALLRNSGLGESTGHPVGERVQEHPEVLLGLPAGVAADVSSDYGVTAHRGTEPREAALVPLLSHVIRFGLDEAPGPTAPEAPEIEVRPYAVPLHHVIPGVDPMPLRLGVALMNPLGYGRIDADGTVFLPDDPRDAAALYAAAAIVADRLGLGEAEPVPSTSQHLSGSARIGEVVDHTGRVMGVDGLYVADASVLPTLPRCGPYYTVLAVAEALAAGLAAERPW
ncbi:mycofactocin system GMC family oxidoreductase MftG [Dietzia aurantiaca]|uniref:Mycofactocin system GMC family oxidoreductase MftG n=1 Tax=Dietzia aurantiaca TaxID=983873 RepID=A0ABV9PLN4_9ACTN